jgi:hypothetical protein
LLLVSNKTSLSDAFARFFELNYVNYGYVITSSKK